MRFTKAEFCTAIDNIKTMTDWEAKINHALDMQSGILSEWIEYYLDTVLDLSDIDPASDMNDIEYFIYDLDFGRKWKPGMVLVDYKDFPLRTTEDLWNLLQTMDEEEAPHEEVCN